METRRSSDPSKHSAEVFAEAEDHPEETATAVAAGLGNAEPEWLDEDETVERP